MKPDIHSKVGSESWVTGVLVRHLKDEYGVENIKFGEIDIGEDKSVKCDIVVNCSSDKLAIECKGISDSGRQEIRKGIGQSLTYKALGYDAAVVGFKIPHLYKKVLAESSLYGISVTEEYVELITKDSSSKIIRERMCKVEDVYNRYNKNEDPIGNAIYWVYSSDRSDAMKEHMEEALLAYDRTVGYNGLIGVEHIEEWIQDEWQIKSGKLKAYIDSLSRFDECPYIDVTSYTEINKLKNDRL